MKLIQRLFIKLLGPAFPYYNDCHTDNAYNNNNLIIIIILLLLLFFIIISIVMSGLQ